MTIDTNAIMKVVTDIMGERQIQITVKQSLKGAFITGTCSLVGGLIAGPIGLAVGGASGGLAAAFATSGTFKPIGQILNELPFERKRAIAIEIQAIIDKLEINDLAEFTKIALLCGAVASPANPQKFLVEKFIQESISVIQRQMLLQN
jgi:hypothetical protein